MDFPTLLSKQELVKKLSKQGLSFRSFSFATDGNFCQEDADWNYRDILHLEHVHKVEYLSLGASKDHYTNIWYRSFLGLKFPMVVFSYRLDRFKHSGITCCFGMVLLSTDVFERLGENHTRVVTEYSLGLPKWLVWCGPIIERLIKRQYLALKHGDNGMRTRRGELRAWGYDFVHDKQGYDFLKGHSNSANNVIPPAVTTDGTQTHFDVQSAFKDSDTFLYGRDDQRGLRFVRRGPKKIEIFPRMCPHEGASLDSQPCLNHTVVCPWHGRKVGPLGTLNLYSLVEDRLVVRDYLIIWKEGIISVQGRKESEKDSRSPRPIPPLPPLRKNEPLSETSLPYSP